MILREILSGWGSCRTKRKAVRENCKDAEGREAGKPYDLLLLTTRCPVSMDLVLRNVFSRTFAYRDSIVMLTSDWAGAIPQIP
jgi:hypothetical protein